MSERNHFRRGKGGQKYRPSGGMRNKEKVERPAKGDQPVKVEEPDEEVLVGFGHDMRAWCLVALCCLGSACPR